MNAVTPAFPEDFPAPWANEWGEDAIGPWQAFVYGGVRHALRWLPPGEFRMGSPKEEADREFLGSDETRHPVRLSRGFWLGETPVTQALWQAAMGDNPSRFEGPERPVETVSWEDATRFIDTLDGRCPGLGLRLPTEAEWEYACRAGTDTPFWFGDRIDTDQANYDGNYPYAGGRKGAYRQETLEVKALPANAWGLFQMHGNVWEWCRDWAGDYPRGSVTDPVGPTAGAERVLRGGGWGGLAWRLRSAYRLARHPGYRDAGAGFRLARG